MPSTPTAGGTVPSVDHTWGIEELHRTVDRVLRRHFPEELWVAGEIAGLDRRAGGHVYLRLVDHDPDRPAGRTPGDALRVVLFDGTKRAVNVQMKRAGIGRIAEGMQVRVRGELELYRGVVQLRMTGIDAGYTLGALAAARDRLLEVLRAEGLLDRNARRPVPALPLRIGLVTSAGSAAEADFVAELRASGFGFRVVHCDTRVQGAGAEQGVAAAIACVVGHAVDLVAVVRGGGDRLDLAVFDSAVIARAIADCPVPVWSGIGHEVDQSVADAVAHTAFKTPTAVAAAIAATARVAADHLDTSGHRLALGARRRAAEAGASLLRDAARLGRAATAAVREPERQLLADRRRLAGATRRVAEAGTRLDATAARLDALDPHRALERGWALLRHGDALVRSIDDVPDGATVEATVADGRLSLVAVGRHPT